MTDQYCVVGNPIGHSRSPEIHTLFARQTGQDLAYDARLIELGEFNPTVQRFVEEGLRGLNVTVPFKQEARELATALTGRAQRAGAVNTLAVQADGTLLGDTTDGVGIVRDITGNLGVALEGQRILVLGAGGAVRGVLEPVLDLHPALLVIANRTKEKAVDLARDFCTFGRVEGCGFADLEGQTFDIVINGTAAGLSGDVPPIPAGTVTAGTFCYDMMYSKEPTAFVRWCREQGSEHAADGLGMLVEQAAESFAIWRGVRPDTAPVIRALREGP